MDNPVADLGGRYHHEEIRLRVDVRGLVTGLRRDGAQGRRRADRNGLLVDRPVHGIHKDVTGIWRGRRPVRGVNDGRPRSRCRDRKIESLCVVASIMGKLRIFDKANQRRLTIRLTIRLAGSWFRKVTKVTCGIR